MATKTGLKVFFDSFSQPSRAVLLLLHANKIQYEPKIIHIARGESRTREDFMKVNPNKKVPAIEDNGFCLFESAAILKYIATKYKLPDHWYPSDVQHRAKVDEYLSWHSSNLRMGAAMILFQKTSSRFHLTAMESIQLHSSCLRDKMWPRNAAIQPILKRIWLLLPRMTGQSPDEKRVEESQKILKRSLQLLETYFLKDHKFISSDELSIADLQALCELSQFVITEIDPCQDKPRLSQWMSDCRSALRPHFDEVHKMLYVARDKGVFKGKL